MDLTWMPDDRRFIGTETEAKKLRKRFEKRDVPTLKPKLIEYLNAQEEDRERALLTSFEEGRQAGLAEAGGAGAGDEPAAETVAAPPIPVQPPPAAPSGGATLVEQILDLGPDQLPQVLSAAIGRLGEVAGTNGWGVFGKSVYGWTPGARSVEQGLGMLMLAAFDSFGMAPPEKARKIIPDKPTGDE